MSTFARAEAYAPASMGNVGVGFDILGLAFCEPGDTVIAERRAEPGVVVVDIQGDGGVLPREAEKNTASVAVMAFLERIHADFGVTLTIHKGLPLASGLGSSAASAVAGVVAANALLSEPLPREALLPCCLEGEALVSGYHLDNVAPALLGGITLITGDNGFGVQPLPVPEGMFLALVTPKVAVPTAEARAVLPQQISLKAMIAQTAGVAKLVDALHRGDVEAIGQAMELDGIVEPARAHLMPLLYEARALAKANGAFGLVISGAGPTLCAVCGDEETSCQVTQLLQQLYDDAGIGAISYQTKVDTVGARVLSVR